jgi:hypothetical protein
MNTDKNGPVGSNTDSGSKIRVYFRYITNLYLAFIIRNLFEVYGRYGMLNR